MLSQLGTALEAPGRFSTAEAEPYATADVSAQRASPRRRGDVASSQCNRPTSRLAPLVPEPHCAMSLEARVFTWGGPTVWLRLGPANSQREKKPTRVPSKGPAAGMRRWIRGVKRLQKLVFNARPPFPVSAGRGVETGAEADEPVLPPSRRPLTSRPRP